MKRDLDWYKLASHLGQPISTVFEKTTSRQFECWKLYLKTLETRPKLTEFYLMQIACEIRRARAKDPNSLKIGDFRIRFEKPVQPVPMTVEEATRLAKSNWTARYGTPLD